ncbi:hypothetical protein [Serratia plymuthica]|uniref:hypothetical protein n=1 Tax=Serratia plymuthica TaxID=82996 RepID=UPI0009363D68|nr:hypothetical protein [Serratia plymuthica]OJT44269.1 hypothetical protein BSR04_05390 [Serratia plymuthica]
MKSLVALIIALIWLTPADAARHPVLVNPRISECSWQWVGGDCSARVAYASDGTMLADVAELAPPVPGSGRTLVTIGLHCSFGSSLSGSAFSSCEFRDDGMHAPRVNNCFLVSESSWELTPSSTCELLNNTWSAHSGAGPGGECVLFVQSGQVRSGSQTVSTINGLLTANAIANSGSVYCQKPLPPNVSCDISLSPTLDHGVIGPDTHSVVDLEGTVNCGAKPVITILGGSKVQLAPGVTTELTTQLLGTDRVRLTSALDAINAEPGDHSGSVVVLASPY